MRKGDARKAAIIETAESLFYTKGYENTSIQDVLDALNLSKGGFYHHFESKLSLLCAICENRVEKYAEDCRKYIEENKLSPVEMLNCVFSFSSYLKDSSLEYISIMLDVAYRRQQMMLREHMNSAGLMLMRDMIAEAIDRGVAENLFYVRYIPELSGILLNLVSCLTNEVSEIAVNVEEEIPRTRSIQKKIEAYNYTAETILNAPHGSIKLLTEDIVDDINRGLAFMPVMP